MLVIGINLGGIAEVIQLLSHVDESFFIFKSSITHKEEL